METSHDSLFKEFPNVLTPENIRFYAKDFKPKPPKTETKSMNELMKLLKMKRSAVATAALGVQWAQEVDKKLEDTGLDIRIEGAVVSVQLKIGDATSTKIPKRPYTLAYASLVFGMGKSNTWDLPELKTNKSQLTALVIFTAQNVHNL
jgi:hypothetical protein